MSSTDYRGLLKKALQAVEELQAKVAEATQRPHEPLAIIGMACRFPGLAALPDDLWNLLREGVDTIKEVPAERWDVDRYFDADPDAPGKMYTRWGAFLERVDWFDPGFFRISPREAANMDPQQRLLLEVCWEALENAGCAPSRLKGSPTGVFVGISTNDFSHYTQLQAHASQLASIDAYLGTGNAFCVASGRVSHFLEVQGPSLAVDTACSSSLVAVDLACQNLRTRRCDLALAGGINLILSPGSNIYFSKARAMAADGRCKTFDASADGYVRGEGCGVIVLKRLSDARRDRDPILAVIRGSAVNHDGPSGGLTVPNGQAQEAVIRAALADGGVAPGQVDYIEAHGTGTPLGDPIEVRALARVFGAAHSRQHPLWVGSVKTNLGHLEAAAGVAGLIKVVLSLQHRQMPAHLHFHTPNPHIEWEQIPVRVVQELRPWDKDAGTRRIAGVSSFGFSGTNAHLVLEEGEEPAPRITGAARPRQILSVSARGPEALVELAGRYASCLEHQPEAELGDVAYTANARRSHFGYRLAVVGADRVEMAKRLSAASHGEKCQGVWRGQAEGQSGVAFLFSGQGSQYAGMGRELYESQKVFREVIERCAAVLKGHWKEDLQAVLWGEASGRLDQTEYTQPALFALEYGLAQVWRSWGVEPGAVLGHSVGEYVAACVAGVMGLEEGLGLVARRAALMQALPREGEMAAVMAEEELVRQLVSAEAGQVSIAAVNAPRQTVISGTKAGVGRVIEKLQAQGVGVQRLRVSHAFHSAQMEGMLEEYGQAAGGMRYAVAQVPLVSNVSGEWLEGAPTGEYWQRHTRQGVQFMKGMRCLEREGLGVFLEVGPQPVLIGLGQQCVEGKQTKWVGSLRRGRAEWEQMLGALGQMYVAGVEVDWEGFDRGYERRSIALPTYPFQRQRYWLEPNAQSMFPPPGPLRDAQPSPSGARAATPKGDHGAQQIGPGSDVEPLPRMRTPELTELLEKTPPAERPRAVLERVQVEVARVLRLDSPPNPRQGFFDMGMDSLMAVELRHRLESILGRAVPPTIAFDYPNIASMAQFVLGKTNGVEAFQRPTPLAPATEEDTVAVAIIGVSCRFPGGAIDPEAFWQVLLDRKDTVCEVPPDRWPVDDYFDPKPDQAGKSYVRTGSFLTTSVQHFDPRFFGITPREAISMDPQQRLLLELCSEALENAGQSLEQLTGSPAGVFVGINANDYSRQLLASTPMGSLDAYTFTGNTFSVAAGRISHWLGLHGPSMAIDTACSSSLVAVHLAVRSLRTGECGLALVGGVNCILSPDGHVILSRMRALAPDGRCKTFDATADGYGRGEGGGVVVLKRLNDAVANGDRILAVIKGSAVNHDGPSSGLTVPNGAAQRSLLRAALADAGVSPERISFIEAHGTGTPLGDPIEMEALRQVFCEGLPGRQPLLVGSVKTNLGHLEAAAGIASLLKAALALDRKQIPAHLHFCQPTPAIPWSTFPVQIPTETTPWKANGYPRVCGVSSFGFSGTNAHVILEEAPLQNAAQESSRPAHLVALSARSADALKELVARYVRHLEAHPGQSIADIGFTANTGRAHFAHRLGVVAESPQQLQGRLANWLKGELDAGLVLGRWSGGARPKVAFLFSGHGSQYLGMGRQLYESEPLFRHWLERCAELAQPYLPRPLLEVLYGPQANGEWLDHTLYTQTGLLALEYALARLWQSWGIEPSVVLGYSVGEFAAATLAGVMELKEAIKLVAQRGRLVEERGQAGRMISVSGTPAQVEAIVKRFGREAVIGACNGPRQVVVSASKEAIGRVEAELRSQGLGWQEVKARAAFHSPLMEWLVEPMRLVAGSVEYRAPQLRWISSVSGQAVSGVEEAGAEYWAQHGSRRVEFERALAAVGEQGCQAYVEVGPGSGLLAMGCECAQAGGKGWLPSLRPGRESQQIMESLGRLYVQGSEVDWDKVEEREGRQRVALPTYPFERQRYWMEFPAPRRSDGNGRPPPANEWFHRLGWFVQELETQPSTLPGAPLEKASWLLLGNSDLMTEEVAGRFRARGDECILVTAGAGFLRKDDFNFSVNPASPSDFSELLAALKSKTRLACRGIIHLWSLATAANINAEPHDFEAIRIRGCGAVLHALQAVVKTNIKKPPRFWVVTQCAQHVAAAARELAIDQAILWGMGRVIAWEHPELWGGLLDLDLDSDGGAAEAIHREITADAREDQIVYRAGQRYIARLVSGSDCSPAGQAVLTVRSDATYMITGGLGSLGRRIAQWLVGLGARHLLLLGRNAPKPEAEAEIATMTRDGAELRVATCDTADASRLLAVITEAERVMPPLRGVIHLAGVLDDGVLMMQTAERFERVLAPKVAGSWNLHALTDHCPLDFFVLFSSAASLLGSPGQANYAAANAFMDSLAHYRRLHHLPALSINWGPWAEAGMAADLARRSARRWIPEGVTAVSTAEGLSTLARLLAGPDAQIAVMPVDWERFLNQFPEGAEPRVLAQIAARTVRPRVSEAERTRPIIRLQILELPAAERRAHLLAYLQHQIGAVMALPPGELPDPDQGLFEMGLDSLMALELKNLLCLASGKDLPASMLFNCPNISSLTDFLLAEFAPGDETAVAPVHAPVRGPAVSDGQASAPSEEELLNLLASEVQASRQSRAQTINGR